MKRQGKTESKTRPEIRDRTAHLRPVDSLGVTIVVDNAIDILLPSDERVHRAPMTRDWSEKTQLIAEHGYSLLLTLRHQGASKSILYDAGLSRGTAAHNLDVLGIKLADLDAMALSHGHADHHGGLEGLIQKTGRKKLPLVLHPDAWRERKIVLPSGAEWHMPPPNKRALERQDVWVLEDRGPTLMLGDTAIVTGQVERVTDFEKGFPWQYARNDGGWEPDPWIYDDQGIVCNVKGKGLVVVSSCSHSGVINVLKNAQKVTGVDRIHAFIGGLHLTGGLFEKIIPQTVDELAKINPDIIVPGHCTGWKATHEIARRLPQSYVQTSVGTTLQFG